MSLLAGPQIRPCQGIQSKQITLTMQDKGQQWCQLCLAHQQHETSLLHFSKSITLEYRTTLCDYSCPPCFMDKGTDLPSNNMTSLLFWVFFFIWTFHSLKCPWGIQPGLCDYLSCRGIMSLWSIRPQRSVKAPMRLHMDFRERDRQSEQNKWDCVCGTCTWRVYVRFKVCVCVRVLYKGVCLCVCVCGCGWSHRAKETRAKESHCRCVASLGVVRTCHMMCYVTCFSALSGD